jgi:hypothetical protein
MLFTKGEEVAKTRSTPLAFKGAPESEWDVAYLLGVAQEHLPFAFAVTGIGTAFPDCQGIDPTTGRRVTIEFEVRSRSFLDHGHPARGCDYIVCWEDNWVGHRPPPAIISLRQLFEATPALRSRLEYVPRAGSVRDQLAAFSNRHPEGSQAVVHLVEDLLPRLQETLDGLIVDDTRTKQFVVRYGSGRRLLCVTSSTGKVEGATEKHMLSVYGPAVAAETLNYAKVIKSISVLRTESDAETVVDALERLVRVIKMSEGSP